MRNLMEKLIKQINTGLKEIDIENYLVKRVKSVGGVAYKFKSPAHTSVPDRLCVFPNGNICFVECKAPGKKPTLAQHEEMLRLLKLNQTVYVIDSKFAVDRMVSYHAPS